MAAQAAGQYHLGIAFQQAKNIRKLVTSSVRNPKDTSKSKLRYWWYHLNYCQALGHALNISKQCFMYGRSKAERNEVTMQIMEEHIAMESHSGSKKSQV